jgi:hypothetical protein
MVLSGLEGVSFIGKDASAATQPVNTNINKVAMKPRIIFSIVLEFYNSIKINRRLPTRRSQRG